MKIELKSVTVREIVEGYRDDGEKGVVGYGGRLDIRPQFQREFIYGDRQQQAVIDTVMNGFPLNVMYWAVRGDGGYEIIDGQQRTLSLCRFVAGDFAYMLRYFHNFSADEKERVLGYPLMVYTCDGGESEKFRWFETINIAGEELTRQELRNAVYAGAWVTDAKRYFSRNGCPAYQVGEKYMSGKAIRQEYLERAIQWKCGAESDDAIRAFMALHQKDASAVDLWLHFQGVIEWAKSLFPKYRREMKGLDWGGLKAEFGGNAYDPAALEEAVAALMADDDVQRKSGIYEYLLSGREREHCLNIRAFTDTQKRAAYERQGGICAACGKPFAFEEMEGDHVVPWCKGGRTIPENLQMLCRGCNGRKGGK